MGEVRGEGPSRHKERERERKAGKRLKIFARVERKQNSRQARRWKVERKTLLI